MSGALIPSNGAGRTGFHSPYAHCPPSMLELTSTDFGYELSVANYGRPGNYVTCYPGEGNENSLNTFNLAWDSQSVYPPYQAPLSCELSGLFGTASSVGRQSGFGHHHLPHGHHGHHHTHARFGPGKGGGIGLNGCAGVAGVSGVGLAGVALSGSSKSKPRRRVATIAQRRAANIRERRRMFNLNEAFDYLRKKVPTFAYEKRLSRIETLRLAITYIAFMTEVLQGKFGRDDSGYGDGDRPGHEALWGTAAVIGSGLQA